MLPRAGEGRLVPGSIEQQNRTALGGDSLEDALQTFLAISSDPRAVCMPAPILMRTAPSRVLAKVWTPEYSNRRAIPKSKVERELTAHMSSQPATVMVAPAKL